MILILILQSFNAEKLGPAGVPVYTLAAETLLRFPDDQTVHLDDPRLKQIGASGITTSVTSKHGTVSGQGDNIYFMDDVKVVRSPYKDRSELTLDTSYLQVTPDWGSRGPTGRSNPRREYNGHCRWLRIAQ